MNDNTVTIPVEVYEGYKKAAAALIAATIAGFFEDLDEETNHHLIGLTEEILASGALK